MPLQDAARPSWRQMLANERKQHGAYDPVRLAKLLPPKLTLQKRSFRSPFTVHAHHTLVKRDGDGGSNPPPAVPLPPAPANSGAPPPPPPLGGADDEAEPSQPVPVNIPQINYGSAAPSNDVPTANTTATHNDTTTPPPSSDQSYTLTPADLASSDDDAAASDEERFPHRLIGMVCGIVLMLLVLIVLGYLFKRYRPKLMARYRGRRCASGWKRSQRLGSIDLPSRGDGAPKVDREAKGGSSDCLVRQSAVRDGPFDRAISTMFTSAPQAKNSGGGSLAETAKDRGRGTTDYLGVKVPKGGLSPQRSLESIAEVQEPPSVTPHSPLASHRKSLVPKDQLPISTPKRLTYADRPRTSPGRTSTFLSSPTASTLLGSPPEGKGGKRSPGRPQSAKGGDIEMTRRGSTLVIRDRASTATLRRPLSSAGNPFKSALRKTRGEDAAAICIETDDLISRAGESDLLHPANPAGDTPVTKKGDVEGVVELTTPVKRGLHSHFSSSTLGTTPRGSCATSMSPSGSFSFEIRDAVRRCAPVTLGEQADRPTRTAGTDGDTAEKTLKRSTVLSVESFVRDLDWNVSECSLVDEVHSPLHKHEVGGSA